MPVAPLPKREKKVSVGVQANGFRPNAYGDHVLTPRTPQQRNARKLEKAESRKSSATGGDVTCDVCYKIFRTKGLLTQHMLVHNNIRRFVCDVCDKAFKQKAHLKTHKRLHTGEKPYTCTMPNCDRQFAQATNLKLHLRSHENRLERVVLSVEPSGAVIASVEPAEPENGVAENNDAYHQGQNQQPHPLSTHGGEAGLDNDGDNHDEEDRKHDAQQMGMGFSTTHSSPPPTTMNDPHAHQHQPQPHHHLQHNPHNLDKLLPHQIQQPTLQHPHHHQHASPPLMTTGDGGGGGGGGMWPSRGEQQVIAGMVPVHDHIRERLMGSQLNDDVSKGH